MLLFPPDISVHILRTGDKIIPYVFTFLDPYGKVSLYVLIFRQINNGMALIKNKKFIADIKKTLMIYVDLLPKLFLFFRY